jgi:hypothetical protein
MDEVVIKAYMDGISIQSDWFRYNAQLVAAAASMGFISTKTTNGFFGRTWRPTHAGMRWLHEGGKL